MSYLTTVVGFSIIIRYVYIYCIYTFIYRVIRFKTLERDSRNLLRMSEARDWTQTISKDCSPFPHCSQKLLQVTKMMKMDKDGQDDNADQRSGHLEVMKTSQTPIFTSIKKSRKAVDTFHISELLGVFFLIPKKLFGIMKKAQKVRIYPPEAIT